LISTSKSEILHHWPIEGHKALGHIANMQELAYKILMECIPNTRLPLINLLFPSLTLPNNINCSIDSHNFLTLLSIHISTISK